MFSLDASHRYWFYNRPVNMRLGFNGLSGIDTCTWLEDTLKRIPTEKDIDTLLPCNFRK